MNLLMISAHLPDPRTTAGERNYHFLQALAQHHTISLLSLVDSGDLQAHDVGKALQDLAYPVQLIPFQTPSLKRLRQLLSVARGKSFLLHLFLLPAMQSALDNMLASRHYDAVFFESSHVAGYRLPAGIKIIIDQHNIEHELLQLTYEHEKNPLRQWYNRHEYQLVKPAELQRCAKANLVLVTSERERLLLQQSLPQQRIEVVRTGIDVETFGEIDAVQVIPHQIVFTGTMNYYPNTNAVIFFAQHCWPIIRQHIPDATWHIVGRNPPPEVCSLAGLPGVTVTGPVRDIRPYLASSAVAIAPLQIGSGTRVKILEALAMRKAIVSTTVGYQGLVVEPGKHLLVADQPAEFASAVVELLRNPQLRMALGNAGRALVEAEYSWKTACAQLVRILDEFSNEAALARTHARRDEKQGSDH
ncbi:MAG TPA: glycosyltransferase [Ktedonobacteraceae bacterium]|jgi:sugar transferase (PEP-CTERM/EpsH1 system associated)|nr:glycosyltransferase [Ktedonobacteraceae bacterium]